MSKDLNMSGYIVAIYLVVFVIMELPIRLFLQPDPWLLTANHWYFDQPLRLLIELLLILILLILVGKTNQALLRVKSKHKSLLLLGVVVSVVLFGLLEKEQLMASLEGDFQLLLMWLLSGFAIGVGQELLYRGLLFTSIKKYVASKTAGILTTIAFIIAPLHSIRLWEYAQQGEIAVVLTLILIYIAASTFFQWLRNHTGSITIPALVHGAGNGITWVAVFA